MGTGPITSADDLRHRAAAGVKTRDSLFWNLVLPDEEVAVQIYVWVNGRGVAGRQIAVYAPEAAPNIVRNTYDVDLGPDTDFDNWECDGLTIRLSEPLRTAEITFDDDDVSLRYRFTARHRPFSYRENPAGCPPWMATDRFEQSGRATGVLRVRGRTIPFADVWAHRDHSWGRRNWNTVHHWKWLVAAVPSGTELNAMFHVARGEPGLNGYVLRGTEPVALIDGRCRASYDADMAQLRLEAELIDAAGGTTQLEMDRYAIFHLPFGSDSLLSEAACRVRIDGEEGVGQFETLWPRTYVQRLIGDE
jgi:hypothetical protein